MDRDRLVTIRYGADPPPRGSFVDPAALEVCRSLHVPPWVVGVSPRPRLARFRWALRRVTPTRWRP